METALSSRPVAAVVPAARPRFSLSSDAAPSEFKRAHGYRAAALFVGDLLAVLLSVGFGVLISTFGRGLLNVPPLADESLLAAVLFVTTIPMLTIVWFSLQWSHYSRVKPFWTETRDIIKMTLYAFAVIGALTFIANTHFSRLLLFSSMLCMMVLVPVGRFLCKLCLIRIGRWFVPLVVVGDVESVDDCAQAITSDVTLGYRIAAKVKIEDFSPVHSSEFDAKLTADVKALSERFPEARLLFAMDQHHASLRQYQTLAPNLAANFDQIILSRPMHGLSAANSEILMIDRYDTLFIRLASGGIGWWSATIKRGIDIAVSAAILIALSPLMLLLYALVRRDGGKAFYASERIGQGGRRFDCYKFRSMHRDSDAVLKRLLDDDPAARTEWLTTFKLKSDPRVTAIGAFLRRSSLDELPQLWNVLRGNMSLVGPRPILPEELANYGVNISNYHGVRPGLTGLWQISGRSNLKYEDRVAINSWYIRNWSLWLDLTILLRTLMVPFRTSDAF